MKKTLAVIVLGIAGLTFAQSDGATLLARGARKASQTRGRKFRRSPPNTPGTTILRLRCPAAPAKRRMSTFMSKQKMH